MYIFPGSHRTPASRAMLRKTIQHVEKLSGMVYFVAVKLGVPGITLPKAIASYFIYFTTDSGRDAFELPYPMW